VVREQSIMALFHQLKWPTHPPSLPPSPPNTHSRSHDPSSPQFISLGLNRVWKNAGDVVYRQGDPAESMYIVISGRVRLLNFSSSNSGRVVPEDSCSRGDAVGG
jgi:CRP-like cAMP-binding protein